MTGLPRSVRLLFIAIASVVLEYSASADGYVEQEAALGDYSIGEYQVPLAVGSISPSSDVQAVLVRWKYTGDPGIVYCSCGPIGTGQNLITYPDVSLKLLVNGCTYRTILWPEGPDGEAFAQWTLDTWLSDESCPGPASFPASEAAELRIIVGPNYFITCCHWRELAVAHLERLDVYLVDSGVATEKTSWGRIRSLYR